MVFKKTKASQTRGATGKQAAGKKPVAPKAAARSSQTRSAQKPKSIAAQVAKPATRTEKMPAKAANPAAVRPVAPRSMAASAGAPVRKAAVTTLVTVPVRTGSVARPVAAPQAAPKVVDPKKPVNQRHGFRTNEFIVYPAHGVGRIVSIEEQEVAGVKLELFVITFDKDKMTLKVPTFKTVQVGMRKLAEEHVMQRALETLKGRARVKRTMWSRRAQEYEAKINSGDLIAIAEVVRDLYRSESQPEQSYSERQLYEAALDRMARELAAVEKLDERGAVQKITEVLARSARGRSAERTEVEGGNSQVAAA